MPIKAVVFDVDGVLTDGAVWWGPNGEEWKRLHFADIMGLSLARKAGLIVALVSGEDSPVVDRLAAKLLIGEVNKNCKDKASAVRALATKYNLRLEEICFMGDDVNDLPSMEIVGLSAAPRSARPSVRERAHFVANSDGGNGAARELIDMILAQTHVSAATSIRG